MMTTNTFGNHLLVDLSRSEMTTDHPSEEEPKSNSSWRRTKPNTSKRRKSKVIMVSHWSTNHKTSFRNCQEALSIHWLPNQAPRWKGTWSWSRRIRSQGWRGRLWQAKDWRNRWRRRKGWRWQEGETERKIHRTRRAQQGIDSFQTLLILMNHHRTDSYFRPNQSGLVTQTTFPMRNMPNFTNPWPMTGKIIWLSSISLLKVNSSSDPFFLSQREPHSISLKIRSKRTQSSSTSGTF